MPDEERQVVIPTEYKAKLPKHLSYPLGAEAVSAALAGVPQLGDVRLWFSDRPVFSSVAFQKIIRSSTPYTVLEVSFERRTPGLTASRSLADEGFYDRKWRVKVYPVTRVQRHAARTALLERGLPLARRWLAQPGAVTWTNGFRRLRFAFDPADGSVTPDVVGEVPS